MSSDTQPILVTTTTTVQQDAAATWFVIQRPQESPRGWQRTPEEKAEVTTILCRRSKLWSSFMMQELLILAFEQSKRYPGAH
jgi:hypothetical protein